MPPPHLAFVVVLFGLCPAFLGLLCFALGLRAFLSFALVTLGAFLDVPFVPLAGLGLLDLAASPT